MDDPDGDGQGAQPKPRRWWALLLAVAATLLTSLTSVGLQLWNTHETQQQEAAAAREGKRYAYNLFIAQARLTARDFADVLECQAAIDFMEHRPPDFVDGKGNKLPAAAGTPLCNGVPDTQVVDIPAQRAAYEKLQTKYVADYGQLADARKSMIQFADKAAADLVETIYAALGSQQAFEATDIGGDIAKLEAERCKEISSECP